MYKSYLFGAVSGKTYIDEAKKRYMRKKLKKIKFSDDIDSDFDTYELYYIATLEEKEVIIKIFGEIYQNVIEFRPSPEILEFLDNYTIQLANHELDDFVKKITQYIRDTLEQGLSYEQSLKYLQAKVKDLTKLKIRQIVETETTRAYNVGVLKESYTSDIVAGYQFEAVLDNRTSDICRPRHGMIILKNEISLLAANTPPLHVHCRSILITLTKYDLEGLSYKPAIETISQSPHPRNRTTDVEMMYNLLNILGGA
jgi:SPP1 gp7 family putative phage head morphogenesis protein